MKDKCEWDLTEIFKNEDEFNKNKKEFYNILDKISEFEGKVCESASNLYNVYKLYENANELFEKLYGYGMLRYHLDMSNQESIKLFKEAEKIGADFSVSVSFITPEIISENTQKIEKFLNEEKKLEPYSRDIKDCLEKKKHVLSKKEENLISNYSEIFANSENTYDIFTNAELKYGKLINEEGIEEELTDANYTKFLKSKNEKVRKQAFNLMYEGYKKYINTISELYLSRVKYDVITSKVRKYESSLEKAVINDDSSKKVYETLIEVINENLNVNHEFMELKKKMLKQNEIHIFDIYQNPLQINEEKIKFEDSKKEILNAMNVLGDEYIQKLKEAFENGWIDVYEKENKKSGAYCMGVYGVHPYVLTNFIGERRDTSTIAHELGHAMHTYYSNSNQNIINAGYTIMVAEVASTVNEILLASYQIKNEENKVKKAELIYELLENIRATLFRQAMFAEFEKIVHDKIEKEEVLSAEDLSNIYYELNVKYFGNSVFIDDDIKYEWARIPHFYSCFYVYKYSTGISSAIAIASKILSGEEGYVDKYKEMLKQGCNLKSIDLLKIVDVDLESKKPYEDAIKFFKEKMAILKKLIN